MSIILPIEALIAMFSEIQSHTYFDKFSSINDHDRYFNNLTPLWMKLLQGGLFIHAEQVWEIATEAAAKWEQRNPNNKIHKGAGFYFWGITCILKEDLEKGFLLMHQAVEEDIKNPNPDPKCTPAYSFVSLDYNQQNQLFRSKVLELAKFVEEKLTRYKTERNGRLTMADFRTRILQNPDLVQQVFLFVYENGMFTNDFQGTFEKLMNSQPLWRSRFSAIEEDIAISYGFRNSAAHKIKNRRYIHAMFNDIVDRIFYLLFFAIEKLYI